jgi:hypothetical protein
MNDYTDFQAARRRLHILRSLREAKVYTLDEVTLRDLLQRAGFHAAVGELRDDLRHCRERDCLVLDTAAGVWIATLTATGGDVAQGLSNVGGIARPEPGA